MSNRTAKSELDMLMDKLRKIEKECSESNDELIEQNLNNEDEADDQEQPLTIKKNLLSDDVDDVTSNNERV